MKSKSGSPWDVAQAIGFLDLPDAGEEYQELHSIYAERERVGINSNARLGAFPNRPLALVDWLNSDFRRRWMDPVLTGTVQQIEEYSKTFGPWWDHITIKDAKSSVNKTGRHGVFILMAFLKHWKMTVSAFNGDRRDYEREWKEAVVTVTEVLRGF